jgi:hypothetical protein
MNCRTPPYPTQSPQLRTEYNNIVYNQVVDDGHMLASYVTSAVEAAWRGDGFLLMEYKKKVRDEAITFINRCNKLDLCQSAKDWRDQCEKGWHERCADVERADMEAATSAAESVAQ